MRDGFQGRHIRQADFLLFQSRRQYFDNNRIVFKRGRTHGLGIFFEEGDIQVG
jgi:hypothetical protein